MSVQPLRHTGPIEHVAVMSLEDAAAVACDAVRRGAVSVGIAEGLAFFCRCNCDLVGGHACVYGTRSGRFEHTGGLVFWAAPRASPADGLGPAGTIGSCLRCRRGNHTAYPLPRLLSNIR